MRKYFEDVINYYKAPHSVDDSDDFKKLSPNSKVLFYTLCKLANRYVKDNGWFYISTSELEEFLNKSKKSVIKAKKDLLKNNFIKTRRSYDEFGKRRFNDYKINGFEKK